MHTCVSLWEFMCITRMQKPSEAREGYLWIPWDWSKLSCGCWNKTQVFCKSSRCS